MNSLDNITIAARLRNALELGETFLKDGDKNALEMRIAANGETLRKVIDGALSLVADNTATSLEIATLKNDLMIIKEKLAENK